MYWSHLTIFILYWSHLTISISTRILQSCTDLWNVNKWNKWKFKLGNKNISTYQSAKNFNNYFINSINELITLQPGLNQQCFHVGYHFLMSSHKSSVLQYIVHITEVICTISSLKNKTSCGYDGLSNKILKLCGSQFSNPITYIYNKSLTCGIFPNHLKYAIIKPCFKKGGKSQVSNYRLITILTGFSKIFKLLIFHRLKHNLVSNNILANEWLGCCDNISTESAIFKLI